MLIYQIEPERVLLTAKAPERDVRYQMGRLEREGQIEPIVVKRIEGGYVLDTEHPEFWIYSGVLVEAAVRLKWPTILVTY